MRKRNAARPRLESIEGRLVLSVAGLFDPTAGIRSAIAALTHAHPAHAAKADVAHPATVHGRRSETVAHHHHTSKTAHPGHHHAPAPKSSGSSNSFSDFFKHLFGGTGL
jgi:hypothetical protein